jgi:hypothetical protein
MLINYPFISAHLQKDRKWNDTHSRPWARERTRLRMPKGDKRLEVSRVDSNEYMEGEAKRENTRKLLPRQLCLCNQTLWLGRG